MGVFLVIRLVIVVQGENAGLSLLPLNEPDKLFSACHIEDCLTSYQFMGAFHVLSCRGQHGFRE